jgi:hypothetical protein
MAGTPTGVNSSVPSEWIDGTQSPTKMPAVVSPWTKYSQTEKRNDKKPAMTKGSFNLVEAGREFMGILSGGDLSFNIN